MNDDERAYRIREANERAAIAVNGPKETWPPRVLALKAALKSIEKSEVEDLRSRLKQSEAEHDQTITDYQDVLSRNAKYHFDLSKAEAELLTARAVVEAAREFEGVDIELGIALDKYDEATKPKEEKDEAK